MGPRRLMHGEFLKQRSQAWFGGFTRRLEERGAFIPAVGLEALRQRLVILEGLTDKKKALELAAALDLDVGPLVYQHIGERLDNDGNCFNNFSGEPGVGKSTISLGIGLDSGLYDQPVKSAGDLEAIVCIEAHDVAKVLSHVNTRGVGFKDEEPRSAGHGSNTDAANILNLQDMIRGAQKSLHMCSPQLEERATTQISLHAIARTTRKRFDETGHGETLCLAKHGDRLIGHGWFPWVNSQVFSWYSRIKDEILDASLNMEKGSSRATHYIVKAVEENPEILQRIKGKNRTDTQLAVDLMMSRWNVDQATLQQISRVLYGLLADVEANKHLHPSEVVEDFSRAFRLDLPPIVAEAVEAAIH